MMLNRGQEAVGKLAALSFGMRPRVELYDVHVDPHQLNNLAGLPSMTDIQSKMHDALFSHLRETKDPRVIGGPVLWDYYPYYGTILSEGWTVDPTP